MLCTPKKKQKLQNTAKTLNSEKPATNPVSSRVEDLNVGLPDYKPRALSHITWVWTKHIKLFNHLHTHCYFLQFQVSISSAQILDSILHIWCHMSGVYICIWTVSLLQFEYIHQHGHYTYKFPQLKYPLLSRNTANKTNELKVNIN